MKGRTPYQLVALPLMALADACSFTVSDDAPWDVTGQRSVELETEGVLGEVLVE